MSTRPRDRLGVIGFGPIGRRLAARFRDASEGPQLAALLVRERQVADAAALAPDAAICTDLDSFLKARPTVAVECASAATLVEAAPALLASGCDILPLSLGAFADCDAETLLKQAAAKGPGRIEVPAGALGSIGFLTAARENGLARVAMRIGYPLERWQMMGADRFIALKGLREPTVFLEASAREIAAQFPGHLNVTIGVALAGLGLDDTQVTLLADPTVSQAWFELEAHSASGPVHLRVDGRDAPVHQDPLDYTTFSVMRLLQRRSAAIAT